MRKCNLNNVKMMFAQGGWMAALCKNKAEFMSAANVAGRVRRYADSEIVRIMQSRGWDCTGTNDGSCPDSEAAADWAAWLIGR